MPSVEEAINKKYHAVISMTDMNKVSEELRRIAADPDLGLGVAILVAWQHGLKIRHIPLERYANRKAKPRQAEVIAASDDCPYVFVHVPIRRIRGNKPKLVELGIMNRNADPALFIYHEDGLIGTFSFPDRSSVKLSKEDIREILDTLFQQGLLMKANIDNRQIQFKDLAAREHIKKSREEVYVRVENQALEKGRLPIELNWEDVWDYVAKALEKKSACNYCSVQAFTQNEATIHSAHVFAPSGDRKEDMATVRNYRLGFTFAPFGDPREVCHFLAWDFPHIIDNRQDFKELEKKSSTASLPPEALPSWTLPATGYPIPPPSRAPQAKRREELRLPPLARSRTQPGRLFLPLLTPHLTISSNYPPQRQVASGSVPMGLWRRRRQRALADIPVG